MRKSAVALVIALAACGVGAGQAAAQAQDPPDGVRIHDKHERHQLSEEEVRDLVTGALLGRSIGSGA